MRRAMRRSGIAVLAAALPLLLGMGATGGKTVIQPSVDFHATATDKDGTKVELDRVNIGGEIQLEGDLGRGNLRIAFDHIKSIDFSGESRDRLQATVHLKQGDDVTLKIRSSLTFHGQTKVGLYEVRARELQRLEFAP